MVRIRRKQWLDLTGVVLTGTDEKGHDWMLEADKVGIVLRGSTFRARFSRAKPWGKCEAHIVYMPPRMCSSVHICESGVALFCTERDKHDAPHGCKTSEGQVTW